MEEEMFILNLVDLPEIVVDKIFGYMSYEELAHLRIVCKRFNQNNQLLLNKGFKKVERYQAKCLREVKTQLPRRESERRNHPLFRHCDILTAIETRLSLLNMTFIKYVDCHMCCFIPGKVIDEIFRVLRFIQNNKTLPRAHELLTELRDISSMAMEHFEEKIIRTLVPNSHTPPSPRFTLPPSLPLLSSHSSPSSGTNSGSPLNRSFTSAHSSDDFYSSLMATNRFYRSCVTGLKKEVADLKSKMNEMRRKVSEQERVALEQNRILSEQTVKLTSQEGKLNEVNRKLLEYDQRFSELIVDVGRVKEEQSGGGGSGGSVVAGSSWNREDPSKKFFVSHSLPTPTIGSAVLVATNVIQPNLVGMNLSGASLASPAYLPASTLTSFPSPGLALGITSATDPTGSLSSTLSSPIITPAGIISSGLLAAEVPQQPSFSKCPSPSNPDMLGAGGKASSYSEGSSPRHDSPSTSHSSRHSSSSRHKKHRKRKHRDDDDREHSLASKWFKS